jgi:hypothetical protein
MMGCVVGLGVEGIRDEAAFSGPYLAACGTPAPHGLAESVTFIGPAVLARPTKPSASAWMATAATTVGTAPIAPVASGTPPTPISISRGRRAHGRRVTRPRRPGKTAPRYRNGRETPRVPANAGSDRRAEQRGTQESNLALRFWRPPCYRYTSPPEVVRGRILGGRSSDGRSAARPRRPSTRRGGGRPSGWPASRRSPAHGRTRRRPAGARARA